MKKYFSACPYFTQRQIHHILKETRSMLRGDSKLSMGEAVVRFENEFAAYCKANNAIATNSCTSALDVVFKALELKHNDEVIVPTQTFFANASSVLANNIRLRLVDVDKDFMLSAHTIESAITPQTKAIVIVHFAGLISPDIFAIATLCKQRHITLIEDCSHAHGAIAIDSKGKSHKAGSIGDIAVFSFYSTKILTCGEGGMIVCKNKDFAFTCRSLANRGLKPYEEQEQFITLGSNYRLPEFSAIMGLSGLAALESQLAYRQKLSLAYKQYLHTFIKNKTISPQAIPSGFRHSFWRFIIFLHKHSPDNIIKYLKSYHIYADAPYKPLLHKQPLLANHPLVSYVPSTQPTIENHMSLPIHMGIKLKDVRFITSKLKEAFNE